jgi:uncharacterized protein Yka (UPF0111/DUF47 family)
VIPKGNRIVGRSGHEAAAIEAWEEAGITGAICPSPLGTYTYQKLRRDGRARTANVRVYPLAWAHQAEDWPERDMRQSRWFSIPEAAKAVDEHDLSALISGFTTWQTATPLKSALLWLRRQVQERVAPVRWFHSLMPVEGRFFDLFESHAATLVAGADALAGVLRGGPEMQGYIQAIVDREHEADDIAREVLQDVRRIFVTPFDRSAITSLISVMDDTIDQMNATAKTITLYEVTEFTPQMRDMAGLIVESARIAAEAMPLLRSIGSNGQRLHELTERLVRLEGDADDIHDVGLKTLFKASRNDPMAFIIGRELYGSLEKAVDRFEDVANEIQGLVIDHA